MNRNIFKAMTGGKLRGSDKPLWVTKLNKKVHLATCRFGHIYLQNKRRPTGWSCIEDQYSQIEQWDGGGGGLKLPPSQPSLNMLKI